MHGNAAGYRMVQSDDCVESNPCGAVFYMVNLDIGKNGLCLNSIWRVAFFAIVVVVLVMVSALYVDECRAQQETSGASAAYAKEAAYESRDARRYAVGTVNGVRLRIPKYYLQYGVVYVGDRRDGSGSASRVVTQNSQIDNFGILLRLSNLEPVLTEQDRNDFRAATSKTFFEKTWMMVSFDNHYPPPTGGSDRPEMVEHWGPFILNKERPYGLMQWESRQSVDDGMRGFYGHVEYFYNKSTITTIKCSTLRKKVPPFDTFDHCEHHFIVPELNLMAEAFYTKKDLYRWREIEARVNDIAHSFIGK
ncbi:hypothetical protein SAMN06295900_101183 [Trinickia caryophylli]|uniref:Uncharacterized protein n=2 Tax=Trinickia caryophylli TaxID=28094 RepID=A0A1X7CCR0_TRICW|nr:hypothetical protein SAMN06295900_101183 [Trinickia caryophylli]